MNPNRQALSDALGQLSVLYPTMRLGQLLEMLATMAGAESVVQFEGITDHQLFITTTYHLLQATKRMGVDYTELSGTSTDRRELLAKLSSVEIPLMQAVVRWANESATTVYDLEDADVLAKLTLQTVT